MKLFYRQIINFFIIFVILFGGAAYLAFWGMGGVTHAFSERSAFLVAAQFKIYIEKGIEVKSNWDSEKIRRFREYIYQASDSFKEVQNFVVLAEKDSVLFELNSLNDFQIPARDDTANHRAALSTDASLNLTALPRRNAFHASWPLAGDNATTGVAIINPQLTVGEILHEFNLKFYLLGFIGVLGIILLSFVGTKTLRSPARKIEKGLSSIDRRKYGYRLKFRKDDEFANVYNKTNAALERMEQLDGVQRKAVQKQNGLIKEIQTIRRFMDMLAHEIKNPLHSFGLNLDVLRTKVKKEHAKQDLLKHVNILDRESEHLNDVVHGFLHYVRPGVPQKERTQVNDLIKEVCEMVAAEADKLNIRIETRYGRSLPEILVDRRQLQQALHNVLKNAIQATAKGDKINIRSWSKRKRMFVAVKDTGAGMDAEQLDRIFDLYYTTKKGGTGLGLPITKRIVESNGGEMQLQSSLEKGTTVTFSFPSS